ncbi:MAG TPA: PAS domain S-box protein [Anaerolineales bacterium]|nr:PAS domain S-box protein [Anaerolineales bacterium]
MKKPVRILIVEDKPDDAALAKREIRKILTDCEFLVVETLESFIQALEVFQPDVVLSEYVLPHFDGMNALKLTLYHAPSIPFVIWTNSISEDVAVECVKAGANNYILKDNIKRLGPAILHALEEKDLLSAREQAEQKYRSIFENSMEGIFQSSPEGRYLNVNPAMARLYGYASPTEMIESVKSIADQIYVNPAERAEFIMLLHSQSTVEHYEQRNYRKDGSVIWTSTSARAVRDGNGNLLYYEGFIQDITKRKEAEEALQRSERRFRALIENGLDDISLLAADGSLLWESPSTNRNLGYAPGEFVGRNIFEMMHPEDLDWTRETFGKLLQAPGERQRGIFRLRRADGSWRWVEAIATNLLNDPSVNAIVINYHDITEQKLAQEALEENQARYQTLVETSHDLIWTIDAQGRFTYVNRAARDIYGYEPEELIGKSFIEVLDKQSYGSRDFEKFHEMIEKENTLHGFETYVRRRDGRQIILSTNSIPLRDEQGNLTGISGTSHDITVRKKVEDAFREERNLLRTLIDNIPDRIYAMDRQGRKTLSNIADWKAAGGKTMEDVIGKTDFDLYPPELAEEYWKLDRAVLDSGEPVINYEEPGQDADGNFVFLLTSKIPLRNDEGTVVGLVGIGRDITERKQTEEKLRRNETRYRLVTKATNDVIWEWDPKTNQLLWSENAQHVFGYPKEEIGPDEKWWDERIHPADRARVIATLEALIEGSGESIWLEEYRFLLKNGSYAYISDRGYIERDETGAAIRMIGAMSNITSRKEAEIERQALLEIMQGLANTKDLQELLKLIHDSIAKVIYAENFFVILHQPITGLFEEIYSVDQYDPPAPPAKLENSITSYVFRSGEPLLLTQASFEELEANGKVNLVGTDSASWLGVPLKTSGRTIGVMAVQDYENDNRYSKHDEDFLASIAFQAALAIERKRSEAAEHEQRVLAEALRDTAETLNRTLDYGEVLDHILSAVGRVVPHDAGSILLIEGELARVVRSVGYDKHGFSNAEILGVKLPLANTTNLGRMLETKQPEVIYDTYIYPGWQRVSTTDWLRSSVGAPILIYGEVIGFICLDSQTTEYFTPVHAERLEAFANQAALAIHNARLLQQAQEEIAERKRAEEALRESEKRFSSAFEYASIGMALVTTEGRWARVNRAVCSLLGYSEEELLQKTFQDITHPDDIQSDLNYVNELLTGKINSYQMEKRYFHKSGHVVWALLSVSLVRDDQGRPQHFISQIQDITDRRESELALIKSQSRYRELFDSSPVSLWEEDFSLVKKRIDALRNSGVTDLKDYFTSHPEEALELATLVKVTDVNQASLDLYRVKRKEDLLKSLPETTGSDVLDHFQEEVIGLLNTPNRFTWEGTETMLDGRPMEVVVTGSIPHGYEEDWSKVIVSINDITQRKQSEIEIRRHITELEAVYENGLSVGRLLEPSEIGNHLINTFARYLPWHHVTIRLRKEHSDDLELVAFNLPNLREEEKADAEQHFVARINKVGQGLSGWVIQTGTPLRTGNVHSHPQYIDTHVGIQSGLYIPLKIGARVIGVISVESDIPDAFTERDERLLATLANQTAIAFENARLYEAMQKELLERKRVEEALRVSETHHRALADSITDILFELDQELRYTHWNKASEALTGIPAYEAIGKPMGELPGISEEPSRIKTIYKDVLRKQQSRTFETALVSHGEKRFFETTAYPSSRGVSVVAKDVTDRKRTETIMQKRFELMEFSARHSLNELMLRTVDEVSELTSSTIGFFHFMDEDQVNLVVQTWSTNALRLFQVPPESGTHLPADQAGVWAEAVRQRRPIIHNDYASLENKRELPEGHAPIVREIVIPIIRNERIMAVMGIANKPQEYTSHDLEIATRLADYAWDVTERKQMEIALQAERNQLVQRVEERTADLSRANSNLARALRVKDEFLANMSHELRTPLNAILGLSESLGEQIAGPLNEKQQKYISTISESGHHLLSLINDILDLAKIDAGQITLDINKVDIHSVCQASLRMVKQLAQKKNQEVSLQIDPGLGLMWADERRLKQMIVNLLGNAVKFTPESGKLGLEVRGNEEANQVAITVWDNGIGIKQTDLQRLFQPFVQLDSGLAREATGTGLGLALVAQMARLHGGSVSASSEAGKGSRFTILLPWEPALAMDSASRMRITGKFRAMQFEEENKPTILLVEDTKEVVMMIKDYLELTGYKVFTAQDGTDGIVQARHVKPDLILMDVQMPGMDGFEATRKLRSDPIFRNTPIIALTALAMPHDRERCLEAGMDEYMSKPVNLKALVKIIQSFLFERQSRIR